MTKVGGIRKIMVLWQAVFLAASPLVTAPPSNLTRLYYNGSAAKSHSTTTQYRQLRRLGDLQLNKYKVLVFSITQKQSVKIRTESTHISSDQL